MQKINQSKKDSNKNLNNSSGGILSQMMMKTPLMQKMEARHNEIFGGTIQKNDTGIPDNLKSGMENLSGMNLDDVKVHYNSPKPKAVQAHAFAQGNEIHIASGQEKHLPHELGHVVQQAKGQVKPTTSVGGVAVNDSPKLESEATKMGERAMQMKSGREIQNNQKYFSNGVSQLSYNKNFQLVIQRNRKPINPIEQQDRYTENELESYFYRIMSEIEKYKNNLEASHNKEKSTYRSYEVYGLQKEARDQLIKLDNIKRNKGVLNNEEEYNQDYDKWASKLLVILEELREILNESLWFNISPREAESKENEENDGGWTVENDDPDVFFENETAALQKAKNIIENVKSGEDPRKAARNEGCSTPTWYKDMLEIRLTQGKTQLRLIAYNIGDEKLSFTKIFSFHSKGENAGKLSDFDLN